MASSRHSVARSRDDCFVQEMRAEAALARPKMSLPWILPRPVPESARRTFLSYGPWSQESVAYSLELAEEAYKIPPGFVVPKRTIKREAAAEKSLAEQERTWAAVSKRIPGEARWALSGPKVNETQVRRWLER